MTSATVIGSLPVSESSDFSTVRARAYRVRRTPLISKGWMGFPVQDEQQRLEHRGIRMRRNRDLELELRRRGDLDFELCAHFSFQ